MSEQLTTFSFNNENQEAALQILKKYPEARKQSAVMPLLDLAQRQNDNWLSRDVVEYVANYLDMPFIRAVSYTHLTLPTSDLV